MTSSLHLLSFHGTLICADPATGILTARLFSEALANVVFVSDGRRGSLMLEDGTARRPVEALHPHKVTAAGQASGSSPELVVGSIGDGVVLARNGLFLSVEPNGDVVFGRARALSWEALFFLDAAEYAALGRFLKNEWYSFSSDKVVRPVLLEGFLIRIGEVEIKLSDLLESLRGDDEVKDLWISFDKWKVERLLLYRPLVFFSVFGRAKGFECLSLSIKSYREHGEYSGDIIVLTDRDQTELDTLLGTSALRCQAVSLAAGDFLDYLLSRFRIPEIAAASDYQPVLYSDADVVTNAPIAPFLSKLLHTNQLCVADEQSLMDTEWYGRELLKEDPSTQSTAEWGFTTGVMGWRSHDVVGKLFASVVKTSYGRAVADGNRGHWSCYDQPTANYVVNKVGSVNRVILSDAVLSLSHSTESMEGYGNRGFVHFCGGLNESDEAAGGKAERMRPYLALIAQGGASIHAAGKLSGIGGGIVSV